jgi:hypothetical protein
MKEKNLQSFVRLNLPKNVRLFRNNVGLCKNEHTTIVYGLCPGSSDLIGWTSIEITPEMIGKKIAVFTAFEIKTEKGKVSPEQKIFLENVKNAGGLGKIIRNIEDINFEI